MGMEWIILQKQHAPSCGDAIDMVHLARQTLGDRALEMELLALFERQAGQIAGRLQDCGAQHRAGLAHTLRGSALAVGAQDVAEAAGACEEAAAAPEFEIRIKALHAAVDAARATVARLLAA